MAFNDYGIYHCLRCQDSGCDTCNKPAILQDIERAVSPVRTEILKEIFKDYKGKEMSTKEKILQANEHLKSLAKHFADIYAMMKVELDPALIDNSNLALAELMKCIKHLALIQGDITGRELMPPEAEQPLNS